MTYNRDMQEDKEPVFDSIDTVKSALAVFTGMLHGIRANPAACAAVASPIRSSPLADLADYLVNRGVPFRKAHRNHRARGSSVGRAARLPLPKAFAGRITRR